MLLPKLSPKSKSCWCNSASCGVCVTLAGCWCRRWAGEMLEKERVLPWDVTLLSTVLQAVLFPSLYVVLERRADVQNVRLCQSGVLFLHSTTLCHIWEESLNYLVTCITVCKSVYNQGLGFSPYLWMTRALSGHSSSTDTVCELHNSCGYMTLLLHCGPRDGWDIWQSPCSQLGGMRVQGGQLLCAALQPAHWLPFTHLATVSGLHPSPSGHFWSYKLPLKFTRSLSSAKMIIKELLTSLSTIVDFSFCFLLIAYGYNIFTLLDEILGRVLVPQLLWLLMLSVHTSLETTLHGNLILAIVTNSFCFPLQLEEWKPWCCLGEKR